MIRVRIEVEQDDCAGPVPTHRRWEHRMGATSSNPRYHADAVQVAVLRAVHDVLGSVGREVDLRQEGAAFRAAEDVLAAVDTSGREE